MKKTTFIIFLTTALSVFILNNFVLAYGQPHYFDDSNVAEIVDQMLSSGVKDQLMTASGQCAKDGDCSFSSIVSFPSGSVFTMPRKLLSPGNVRITDYNNGLSQIDFKTTELGNLIFLVDFGSQAGSSGGQGNVLVFGEGDAPKMTNIPNGVIYYSVNAGSCTVGTFSVNCSAQVNSQNGVTTFNLEFIEN